MKKKNSGGYSGGVTPVPIPNTAVKSSSAHGTRFSWESGSLPVFFIYILLILDSSVVEHSAVNRRVAGSSPARGAKGKILYEIVGNLFFPKNRLFNA